MNNRFSKRTALISSVFEQQIREIDELKNKWSTGAELDRQILSRLKKSVLVTSTGASTRIEGSQMSDEDIEKLMRGLSIQKFKDRDMQEVKGYYELLTNIFDRYQSIPFSESTIKFFHRELLKHADKDQLHRGEYKKIENRVEMINNAGESIGVLFDTTKAYLTPKEMQELVEWTQEAFLEKKYHPLLIVGNFIVEFLNIHPFQDGNGRISRILANLMLLQHGYLYMPYISHEKLIEDNKPEYYLALRKSQKTFRTDSEDLTPWLQFFFGVMLEQSKRAVALLSTEETDKLLSKQQQIVWKYMETVSETAPLEISKATGVPRPTVSQAITKLLKMKRIERIGLGRSTRYRKI
ncbi:MAG: Fic family protein [Candidatus Paceibacterota bacterium]|jgi:Fic family protein